jgi:adenosylhomocysteinase
VSEQGQRRIDWTSRNLPMLAKLRREYRRSTPFAGHRIGVCLHVEPKTAVLCEVLRIGGADLIVTGSPGTTQDDVAAALASSGSEVITRSSDGADQHRANVAAVVAHAPDLLLDNGADLIVEAIATGAHGKLVGATEETTTGANRLREDVQTGLDFPVIVINDSPLKRIIENEHGVGQSVVQAFMQHTNLMLPGRRCVVIGYGWCGRGIARTLRKLGARVAVVDPDEVSALEAAVDGMAVGPLDEFLPWGEAFFTVTGRSAILGTRDFERMRDGAVLANAGHFSWEIDVEALRADAVSVERPTSAIEEFRTSGGRRLVLLAGGEMLNLAGAGGNPIGAMDLGLSLQARSLELLASGCDLPAGTQPVPTEINRSVARAMLDSLGLS